MDDPVEMRVSTVGRVHPNTEVCNACTQRHLAPVVSHCCRAFPDLSMSFPGLTLPDRIHQNDTFLLTLITTATSNSLPDCLAYWEMLNKEPNESEAQSEIIHSL